MLWLALHLPSLSLESWAATLAAEEGGLPPLALLHEHRIEQIDAAARALGVRVGMRRITALALAPTLRLGQADALRDVRALRAVAHVALQFSPSVTWATPAAWRPLAQAGAGLADAGAVDADELDAIDTPPLPTASPALVGVRLEVQSCLRLHGGLPRLIERLRAALAELGHRRVRIASAPTAPGAALLAAWRKDLADGPHSSDAAALQALLDQVPLALLAAARPHGEALQSMGLQRLGDLQALPRAGLARRFGPELLAEIDAARGRGRSHEAQRWLRLPAQFTARLELHTRADSSAQMLPAAGRLLAQLLAWARARQVGVARFTLELHHEPRHRADDSTPPCTRLAIAPAQPGTDAAHLTRLLTERLERLLLPAPALELSLHCRSVVAAAPPSGELFLDAQASAASRQQGLARLVERLQARLGREQVQCFAAVADHRPEQGTRWEAADPRRVAVQPPPGISVNAGANTSTQASTQTNMPTQPIWLLPQPQRLDDGEDRPRHQGRPLQLLAGPERLETGWWDGALALRDYFIARADDGALLWVFRSRGGSGSSDDAAAEGWFLQGWFG